MRMTDEIKCEIDIREFECPFCGHKKVEKVHDIIFNERTGEEAGYSIDYWECDKCGTKNDIGLESFENEFSLFRKFTDKKDWSGLYEFCKNSDYDEFMLSCLANLYNQQRRFEKAINLAVVMLRLEPRDPDAEIIIKNALTGIKNRRWQQ